MGTPKTTARARPGRGAEKTEHSTLTSERMQAILKQRPNSLRPWASIAKQLDVPLWCLLIPGLDKHPELLTAEGMRGLVEHVETYIASSGQDEAARRLARNGALDAVRSGHFTENDRGLPIAGTPKARSCPFCGNPEPSIVFVDCKDSEGKAYKTAHAQCDSCGAEAGYASSEATNSDGSSFGLALEVAERWNERKGATKGNGAEVQS